MVDSRRGKTCNDNEEQLRKSSQSPVPRFYNNMEYQPKTRHGSMPDTKIEVRTIYSDKPLQEKKIRKDPDS